MESDVVVNLGTALSIIGVMLALFARVDRRIDGVEERVDGVDKRIGGLARDVVDVKVSVARIEGYLEARDRFMPGVKDRPASEPAGEPPATGFRHTG